MKFLEFKIKNFKGIKEAVLKLNPKGESQIFTLVGLNESGKTTVLEAINSFFPDTETQALFENDDVFRKVEFKDLVPKYLKHNFTDTIEVTAKVHLNSTDLSDLKRYLLKKHGLILTIEESFIDFPISMTLRFESSNFKENNSIWCIDLPIKKTERAKRTQDLHEYSQEIWEDVINYIQKKIPKICYFPTFLFDFPEKIYLSNPPEHLKANNEYYKSIIQDILDSTGQGLNIQEHIVDRINFKNQGEEWSYIKYQNSDMKKQVDAVLEQLSQKISKTVFTRWDEIFGSHITKNIQIDLSVGEGTENPPIFIMFQIKEGGSTYGVAERSLGFRWFFCFLLFTQFRGFNSNSGTLFLLDEPASNLHATAQKQLLKSFESIVDGGNSLIYSTHSHYMINPNWLENCYIIQNNSVGYDNEFLDDSYINHQEPNVIVSSYKTFVGENPDKTTYFQPILDAIKYSPSILEHQKNTIMLEGKGDFYVFNYFKEVIFKSYENITLVPSSGANDLGPLISLYLGWGYDFLILLDDDNAGESAKQKYLQDWYLPEYVCNTLGDIDINLTNKKLEDLISKQGKDIIKEYIGSEKLSKKQIVHFFQENLAMKQIVEFDEETISNFQLVLDWASEKFNDL